MLALALAVPAERVLSLKYHRAEYILCDHPLPLAHRESMGHRCMLAAAVLAIGVLITASYRRRHRQQMAIGLMAIGLVGMLALNVVADGYAAGGDAVARQSSIMTTPEELQQECTELHPTNFGWFDWTPLGHWKQSPANPALHAAGK